MAKLILERVSVAGPPGKAPLAFTWRGRLYRVVEVVSWWREPGAWWRGEPVRLFVRVNARRAYEGTYDLCRMGEEWLLYRVHD